MKKTIFLCSLIGFASLFLFSHAPAVSLYDDFSTEEIDQTRWKQGLLVREIDPLSSKLSMKAETPSGVLMKEFPYSVQNELGLRDPDSVTSLQAEVTVLETRLEGSARTYAFLGGRFYNVSAGSHDTYLGDVYAEVSIRETGKGLEARWYIGKYRTAKAKLWDMASRALPVTIEYGKPYTLSIEFDADARRFTFKAGSAAATYGPLNVPRNPKGAVKAWKALGVTARAYRERERAFISATFDDVQVNGVPYEDFSSPRIDETKWVTYEYVREIKEGKFRCMARGSTGSTDTVNSYLSVKSPKSVEALQATVTLLGWEASGGASAFARLGGNFYNDGTEGKGFKGEIGATVTIGGSDLNPKGEWSVLRFNDKEGNIELAEVIASGEFSTPVALGDTYTLFLQWDGSRFTFILNDEEVEYVPDPKSIRRPSKQPWRGLGCGVWFNVEGQEASVEAAFDDVMVGLR